VLSKQISNHLERPFTTAPSLSLDVSDFAQESVAANGI
jgi:hypothetical protein